MALNTHASIQNAGSIILGTCYAAIDNNYLLKVIQNWKGYPSENSNPIDIQINRSEVLDYNIDDRIVGKNIVAFLTKTIPANATDNVFHLMNPADQHIMEADPNLIRLLDTTISNRVREIDEFPRNLRRSSFQPNDGFLVPVMCSRTNQKYFYQLSSGTYEYICSNQPIIKNHMGSQESQSVKGILDKIQNWEENIPGCPYCGWTMATQCEKCGSIHCIPRSGQTFMGNGCCLGQPDRSHDIFIQCPTCGTQTVHEHHYYAVPENERRPLIHGDSPT